MIKKNFIIIILIILFAQTIIVSAQKDTINSGLKFDFGITRDKDINLWPVFTYKNTSEIKKLQILFPLSGFTNDIKNTKKHSHFLPLWWNDSSSQKKDLRILSSYYPSLVRFQKKDDYKSFKLFEFAPNINLLEISKSSDGTNVKNNLLFFLWHKNNQIEKKSYLVVFPTYWSFSNPKKTSKTFFPFYSKGNNKIFNNNYYAITPLFWHFENIKEKRNILFPVYFNREKKDKEIFKRSNVIFPFYWSYQNKYRNRNNKIFFPFIMNLKSSRYKSFTFFPIISKGQSPDSTKKHLAITPLFWHLKNPVSRRNILFPVYFNRKRGSGERLKRSNIIFPVFWSYKNNVLNKNNKVLFPLIWNLKKTKYKSYTFIPFISKGQSSDSTKKHLVVTPLFWSFKNNDEYRNILFPFYFNRKNGEGERLKQTNVFFPFYWSFKNNIENKNSKVIFPFVWSFKNTKYNSFTFFPLLSKGHSADSLKKHLAITPLFWHLQNKDKQRNIFFPVIWNKKSGFDENKKYSNIIFPVYWSYKSKKYENKVLFPLMWRFKTENYKSLTLFPFMSKGHSSDSSLKHLAITPLFWHLKNPDGYKNILFPLWFSRKLGKSDTLKHLNVVFPLYWSFKNNIKNRRNTILFPIIWNLENPKYKSFTFIPFISKGHTPDSSKKHLVITPLYWNLKNPDNHKKILFPFLFNSTTGIGKNEKHSNIVFPFYWSFKDKFKDKNNKVLFPFIWSIKNFNYESFTLFPFMSKGNSADSTQKHFAITPLFWHLKNSDSRRNILLPLFYNSKTGIGKNQVKTNIILPFYLSYKSKNYNNKILFPLIWKFKSPKYKSFTFLPFISKGHSIDSSRKYLVITPLFWHFKKPRVKTNILFPIIFNRNKVTYKEKIKSNVVFPLFWSYKNNEYKRLITPLFYQNKNKNGNSNFSILYFLYRKSKKAQKKSTSFLWPICKNIKDTNYRYFRFAPLIWSEKTPEFKYFSIQPFYYQEKTSEYKNYNILWQLFIYKNYYNNKKSRNFLWKTIFWDTYDNKDYEFRILHLLFAKTKIEDKVEKSLFPIFQFSKDKKGNRSLFLFFYFYHSLKKEIPNTNEFYMEEKIFWFIRLRSNKRYLEKKGINL